MDILQRPPALAVRVGEDGGKKWRGMRRHGAEAIEGTKRRGKWEKGATLCGEFLQSICRFNYLS